MNIVGVDLGGTKVRAVLADGTGKLLARTDRPTQADRGLDSVIDNIVSVINKVMSKSTPGEVLAIGIGAPGPLNPRTGVVFSPPNLPGWTDVPLRDLIEAKLGLPVYLGNDANLAALGEYTFGAGKEYRYLVYITVSTGIGGGIIEDGNIIHGSRGAAGEIGHMTIKLDGPVCNCGNIGCFEALASGTAIRKRALDLLNTNRPTLLRELSNNNLDSVNAVMVEKAAKLGDEAALELLYDTAIYLGVGITNILHLFNPEIVVIGGGVSQVGDLIFEPLRAEVNRRAMPAFRENVPIVPTDLGDDVGLYGTIALVLQNYEDAQRRKQQLAHLRRDGI
ncbi:MAG: ROK family protein [Chloroflexi bacterium]|uniref:ROK family protein n=1 Tax=Candidatus Chlorohelix allophototropha TaxID=3003348 RepID=A0A8T7M0E7_9CHLR|nr:ROK family protein [Chloroflexota bacterium]WJW67251.1 ROK family protein [Chloroflexota bacterium L227-S17]